MISLFLFMTCLCVGMCGHVTILESTPDLVFDSGASLLRTSVLDDVLIAALGYTPVSSAWGGMSVRNPFRVPNALVVYGVHKSGAEINEEGITYELKEDEDFSQLYAGVSSIVGSHSQRATYFKHLDLSEQSLPEVFPDSKKMNKSLNIDKLFLAEISSLEDAVGKVLKEKVTTSEGQDVIFVEIYSFAGVVELHGPKSPQVEEAADILSQHIGKTNKLIKDTYGDKALILSVKMDGTFSLKRETRALRAVEEHDLNLAKEYTIYFPVIFNIILWTSILLAVIIIAIAMAMALMDPGKDSIIYRMTNPRVKKDQ